MTAKTDRELYGEFLNGDMDSFESLIRRLSAKMIYFIECITKDHQAAEDISQDVFAFIYMEPHRYDPKYELKTYLYTIAKRKAIDHLRKQKRLTGMESMDDETTTESAEDAASRQTQKERLTEAIKMLNEDQRTAIWLVDIEGYSYAEAARIMRGSLARFKSTIFRARKHLALIMNGMNENG